MVGNKSLQAALTISSISPSVCTRIKISSSSWNVFDQTVIRNVIYYMYKNKNIYFGLCVFSFDFQLKNQLILLHNIFVWHLLKLNVKMVYVLRFVNKSLKIIWYNLKMLKELSRETRDFFFFWVWKFPLFDWHSITCVNVSLSKFFSIRQKATVFLMI